MAKAVPLIVADSFITEFLEDMDTSQCSQSPVAEGVTTEISGSVVGIDLTGLASFILVNGAHPAKVARAQRLETEGTSHVPPPR